MVNSQNGWPAYDNTSHFVRFTAGGRGWWAANDDAAVIAADFIEWFNDNIELVIRPGEEYDDWSYANRLVRGSTKTVSNHGSATAWDINAVIHPRGVPNTFSASEQKKIRAKIKEYDGALRWGGDYTTVVDDMHIEINASKAKVKQVADRIREKNVFTKDDKEWISKEIADQLKTFYTETRIIPNKVLKEGDKPAADWTPAGAGAATDQKLDFLRKDLAELTKAVAKLQPPASAPVG